MKRTLYQQIHKKCGGAIIVVAGKDKIPELVCDECAENWVISSPLTLNKVPKDFESLKKGRLLTSPEKDIIQ